MAENQRIHPVVDMEAPPPTRPLVPRGTPRSEKGNSMQHPPLIARPTVPVVPAKPPKQKSCCCRCICWTIGLLVLLLIIIAAVVGILYLVFKPKIPNYSVNNLCHGPLPKFYQGHQNRTVLDVALTGQSQYGRTLMAALQEEQQTGRIPLDLKINVPVRIKLGKLKLPKVRILGDCMLIVDSLSTDSLISIKASTCKFSMNL